MEKHQNSNPIYYSRTMTADNLSKAINKTGEWVLQGLGKIGELINHIATSGATTDFGLTSPFVMSSMKERKNILKNKLKAQQKTNKKITQGMTWVSPLNYSAALLTGHGLNAKKGEEEVASWSPALQAVGRVGELIVGPKAGKGVTKGVKAAAKTPKKVIHNYKNKKVAETIDKVVDNGFIPRLSSDNFLFRTTTDKEVSALQSGHFQIHPNTLNHGVYGWRRGEPFYLPHSLVESKMVGKRNGLPGINNPTYLIAPVTLDLKVRIGSGGKYSLPVSATSIESGTSAYYHPAGGLAYDNSSIGFLPGDNIPQNIVAWSRKNGKWQFEPIIQPKIVQVEPLNFSKQNPSIVGSYKDTGGNKIENLNFLKQYFALLKIKGNDYTLLPSKNIQTGLPEHIKNYLNENTVERAIRAMRENGYSEREIQLYVNKVNQEMDKVKVGIYSQTDYKAAGAENSGGFFDDVANFISVNKDAYLDNPKFSPSYILKHEGRHLIDYRTSMTDNVEKILADAYDNDFLEIPTHEDAGYLKGYKHMDRERVTTNRDARDNLLVSMENNPGEFLNLSKYVNTPNSKNKNMVDFLNELILYTDPEDIVQAVETSNGYGRRYINYLRNNNKLTPTKIEQLRQAMIHVPSYISPVTGYTLYNLTTDYDNNIRNSTFKKYSR